MTAVKSAVFLLGVTFSVLRSFSWTARLRPSTTGTNIRGDVPFGKALPPLFAGVVDCPYSVCVCCSLVESPDDGQCAERRCNDVGGQQVVAAELPEWEGLHR